MISNVRFRLAGVRHVRRASRTWQARCVCQQTRLPVSSDVLQMRGLPGTPGRSRLLRARGDALLRETLRGTAQAEMRRVRRGEHTETVSRYIWSSDTNGTNTRSDV